MQRQRPHRKAEDSTGSRVRGLTAPSLDRRSHCAERALTVTTKAQRRIIKKPFKQIIRHLRPSGAASVEHSVTRSTTSGLGLSASSSSFGRFSQTPPFAYIEAQRHAHSKIFSRMNLLSLLLLEEGDLRLKQHQTERKRSICLRCHVDSFSIGAGGRPPEQPSFGCSAALQSITCQRRVF